MGQYVGQIIAQNLGLICEQIFGQNVGQIFGQNVGQNLGHIFGQCFGRNVGQIFGQNLGHELGQDVGPILCPICVGKFIRIFSLNFVLISVSNFVRNYAPNFVPHVVPNFAPNLVPKFALKTFAAARCCYKKILGKPLQNFEQYFGHDLGKARQDFGQHFGHVFGKTRFPSLKLTLSEFCPNFCRGLPTLCPKICPRLPDSCPNICSSRKTKESIASFEKRAPVALFLMKQILCLCKDCYVASPRSSQCNFFCTVRSARYFLEKILEIFSRNSEKS